MGPDLATSPPPMAVLPVVFVDGDQSVDLGTVTVQPSLGVKKLQAVVADRVGLAPNQISASLARPRRGRRVPLDEATDLAAAVAREGSGCYVQAALRRSRRGGRSRRDKKQAPKPPPQPEKTILKRLPPTDLASLAAAPPPMFGAWDYEAQLLELQRHREWYLINTQQPDPYFALAPEPEMDWSPRRPSRCHECEAAAAAMREPAFHRCVRDAVTVGFRSHVGPIERPHKKSPSSPPARPMTAFLGMPVY
ncbi:hypothetical protein QOZ80_4BG0329440 [Eleusine coracana subsp. coracana]|nr:hypothetical protein QOZ80_4BG0329440 [Eleusine coracana subsp. coracana]